ncbi:protein Shroom2 [Chanos chanos]|uniref:Protein Shroom2 n=1 Tax=Chanos chanos TaxID=29144 RepID=A0A6J2V804_CHACN|nr:protein Shroom2-like [Chanos chanos]
MEVMDSRSDFGAITRENRTINELEPWRPPENRAHEAEEWALVDVVLTGGAPWGFTLKGGLEYREPLIITKVEEGSRAAAVRLQVGDEIVQINEIPLSGYRQEAVYLVKSSYKTLALLVRRRDKMVNIATQAMPAETDVHVARSFLTKILRSSMRKNRFKGRNEPSCRPHSWHSSKLSENLPGAPNDHSTPVPEPVWQTKYTSPTSNDLSNCLDHNNVQQLSGQFSSMGKMDNIERPSHLCPRGRLSSTENDNDHSLGHHDSPYSPFSSCTPDHCLSRSSMNSTENVFYRGSSSELAGSNDRHRYLQLPVGNCGRVSPRLEEQAGYKFSTSVRSNVGPVWHVPEKRSVAASSPPPPPPPLRSDSFVATKVHEKSLVIPYSEGSGVYSQHKSQSRVTDRQFDTHHATERLEAQHSYNPPPKMDLLHPYIASEDYNCNRSIPNKLFSLSSADVRQGQNPFAGLHQHERQRSDESPFYLHPKTASAPKTQSVGSYYRSLQDLPTNTCSQNKARTSMASLSSTALDQSTDNGTHFRYYCITAQQPTQATSQSQGRVAETWWTNSENSVSSQKAMKAKYPSHHPQYSESMNSKQTVGLPPPDVVHVSPGALTPKPYPEEREMDNQRKSDGEIPETPFTRYLVTHHAEQRNPASSPQKDSLQDPWVSLDEQKICPHRTPMLHSLAQENKNLLEKHLSSVSGDTLQEAVDPSSSKHGRRSDRYATTLRNEILQKKAQLQKSRSAATLTYSSDVMEDDLEIWKSSETSTSSSDGSFTNTYKDHLKEAQARVLQATSFRRRDLELPSTELLPGQATSKLGLAGGQVSRVGGRKRFSVDKRVHSFSEPNKINEVGVEEKPSNRETVKSFVDRCKFFEGTSKPNFSKPVTKQSQQSPSVDSNGSKIKGMPNKGTNEMTQNREASFKQYMRSHGDPNSETRQSLVDQQRLGTFAEYEATWNIQRKSSDGKTSGRYRSAENILDSGVDEGLISTCIHERSRSSPSADFSGQKIPLPLRKSLEHCLRESKPDQEEVHITSTSERGHHQWGAWEKPPQHDHLQKPPDSSSWNNLEHKDIPVPLPTDHRHKPEPSNPVLQPYPHSLYQVSLSQQLSPPKNKSHEPHRPSQPKVDKPTHPETTSPFCGSKESVLGSQSVSKLDPALSQGPNPGPSESDPQLTKSLEEEQRSGHIGSLSILTSLLPSPVSSSSPSLTRSAGLTMPHVKNLCCPSPQFSAQRLIDKPAGTMQDADQHSSKMEDVTESNTTTDKVLVRIVHAENGLERENRHHLQHREGLGGSEDPAHAQFSKSSPQEPYSPVFCSSLHYVEAPRSNGFSGRSEEDEKREELARDIMVKDKSLADILDQRKMKTTMDLMEGIFPQGEQLLEGSQQRRKAAPKPPSSRSPQERTEDSLATSVSLVTSSSYYSTSAPKAELLIKMKDMQEHMEEQEDLEDELDYDLSNKKQELIDSLSRKLQVLREARESLQEDIHDNNALGDEVEATVQDVCKPNELDKFRMFVGDLDKVVSLLLSLSGRLARVENALNNLDEGACTEEKHTLTEKRKLLIRQHEDAKELKENLDRREHVVYHILASYLSSERLADYEHFVKMKSALIIEQRKLEDKIKLGEEQLKCLRDSLPLEQRLLSEQSLSEEVPRS